MNVELTNTELATFAKLGITRTVSAMAKKRKGAHGFDRNDERWQIDVEGVLTEAAAAKALNLFYLPVVGQLDTTDGDIAPGVQVRGTKYPSGCLLVHDSDDDDHRFILVTGKYGNYEVRGWIHARDGKKPEYWKTHKGRGAYWVPQSALNSLEGFDASAG